VIITDFIDATDQLILRNHDILFSGLLIFLLLLYVVARCCLLRIICVHLEEFISPFNELKLFTPVGLLRSMMLHNLDFEFKSIL
jgi:hypothetical protein